MVRWDQSLLPGNKDRTRGNGLKLQQERLRLDFRDYFNGKVCKSLEQATQGRGGITWNLELFKNLWTWHLRIWVSGEQGGGERWT